MMLVFDGLKRGQFDDNQLIAFAFLTLAYLRLGALSATLRTIHHICKTTLLSTHHHHGVRALHALLLLFDNSSEPSGLGEKIVVTVRLVLTLYLRKRLVFKCFLAHRSRLFALIA
jgi:hypothetical protein